MASGSLGSDVFLLRFEIVRAAGGETYPFWVGRITGIRFESECGLFIDPRAFTADHLSPRLSPRPRAKPLSRGPCRQRAQTDRWFPARLRDRDDSFLRCAVCVSAQSTVLGRAAQAHGAEAAKFRGSRSEMPKACLGLRRQRGDLSLLGRPHRRHSLRDGVKGTSSTCNSGGTHRLSATGFLYGKAGFI